MDRCKVSGDVCGEMTEEISPGGGVSRKHGMAELANPRLQRDAGHQHPARLAQHLAGEERRGPRPLRNTAPLTRLMQKCSVETL